MRIKRIFRPEYFKVKIPQFSSVKKMMDLISQIPNRGETVVEVYHQDMKKIIEDLEGSKRVMVFNSISMLLFLRVPY